MNNNDKSIMLIVDSKNNKVIGAYNVRKISLASVLAGRFILQNNLNYRNKVSKSFNRILIEEK